MTVLSEDVISDFRDRYAARGIVFDEFQNDALSALARGEDVLVSAPTGSGKTIVALGAVELALSQQRTCIYTAPIKALSNQKYRELCATYGSEMVGLLTGDETINREGQVLVVTTEVLRNMLIARDAIVRDLGFVVLDEVHYLADETRGPVWEEIILQLPLSVQLVALSATIANLEEFANWMNTSRTYVHTVVSYLRPVPLTQYVFDHGEITKLYGKDGKLNSSLRRKMRQLGAQADGHNYRNQRRGGGAKMHRSVLSTLQRTRMLPAIEFIFSRKACDRAVQDLLDSNVMLTDSEQRAAIEEELTELRSQLSSSDAQTVRFDFWARALRSGFGAHHAGMFPPIKELTERLMDRGLISLVYATGTLALGIDMPVRTVVIDELRRFNGTDFVDLSATEYTQLIGRAGRRGKDPFGNAVVCMSPDLDLEDLADKGSGALEPMNSAFFPSYNTVVNLLQHNVYGEARATMGQSFAQFQKNRDLAQIEARIGRVTKEITRHEDKLRGECERGDLVEYLRLREKAGRATKSARKAAKLAYRQRISQSWRQARTGVLYAFARRGELDYGVILSIDGDRARLIDVNARLIWLREKDLTSELRELGDFTLPVGLKMKSGPVRDSVAEEIFDAVAERLDLETDADLLGSWDRGAVPDVPEISSHPVHSCPDLAKHIRLGAELVSLDQRLEELHQRAANYDDSVAAEFDATAGILGKLGYLQGLPTNPTAPESHDVQVRLREGAALLSHIHNESDLLITLCLREGIFEELNPAQFAGICSAFLSDRRLGSSAPPSPSLRKAWKAILQNFEFLREGELAAEIERTSEPSSGGIEAFTLWASGAPLAQVLRSNKIEIGDFMAANRRLIDLLGQMVIAGQGFWLGEKAANAQALVRRWDWL